MGYKEVNCVDLAFSERNEESLLFVFLNSLVLQRSFALLRMVFQAFYSTRNFNIEEDFLFAFFCYCMLFL